MKKNYCFSFNGNLDEFNTTVKRYIENKDDDFLFSQEGGKYSFGIQRGGHSGGYWYVPEYCEIDGLLIIKGKIEYVGPKESKLDAIILAIFLFPVIVLAYLIRGIIWLFKRIIGKQTSLQPEEKKLNTLMIEKLGCNGYLESLKNDTKKRGKNKNE